jgi:hypothetical protein
MILGFTFHFLQLAFTYAITNSFMAPSSPEGAWMVHSVLRSSIGGD